MMIQLDHYLKLNGEKHQIKIFVMLTSDNDETVINEFEMDA